MIQITDINEIINDEFTIFSIPNTIDNRVAALKGLADHMIAEWPKDNLLIETVLLISLEIVRLRMEKALFKL